MNVLEAVYAAATRRYQTVEEILPRVCGLVDKPNHNTVQRSLARLVSEGRLEARVLPKPFKRPGGHIDLWLLTPGKRQYRRCRSTSSRTKTV